MATRIAAGLRQVTTAPRPHLHAPAGSTKRFVPVAQYQLPLRFSSRLYSQGTTQAVEAPEYLTEGERKIFDMLKEGLQPTTLEVKDVSGGCGSMYALDIVSDQFKGMPIIKQHRLVNKVLGEEIKKWHGVQLKTKAP